MAVGFGTAVGGLAGMGFVRIADVIMLMLRLSFSGSFPDRGGSFGAMAHADTWMKRAGVFAAVRPDLATESWFPFDRRPRVSGDMGAVQDGSLFGPMAIG